MIDPTTAAYNAQVAQILQGIRDSAPNRATNRRKFRTRWPMSSTVSVDDLNLMKTNEKREAEREKTAYGGESIIMNCIRMVICCVFLTSLVC